MILPTDPRVLLVTAVFGEPPNPTPYQLRTWRNPGPVWGQTPPLAFPPTRPVCENCAGTGKRLVDDPVLGGTLDTACACPAGRLWEATP